MAGLTIHRTISNADQLAAWVQVVEYALLQKETFRLSVSINHHRLRQGISQYLVRSTLSALSRALPPLARLRVNSSCHVIDLLLTALAEPAPFLHTLEVCNWDPNVNVSMTSLPPTLLHTQPASLRAVTLAVPILSPAPAPVPAFANVSVVHLTIGHQQHSLAVGRLFPGAREPHLRVLWADDGVTIDLSQLSLRLLVVESSPYGPGRVLEFTRCSGGRAPQIAAVEYTGTFMPHYELLWPAQVRELTGHMRRGGASLRTTIEFSSTDPAWRFTARLPLSSSWTPTTLSNLQLLPLVALTVDEAVLDALVQAPITLPELRELSVDFSAPLRWAALARNGYGWNVPEETLQAVIVVSMGVTCTLDLFFSLESLFIVPHRLLPFARLTLFLCIMAAILYGLCAGGRPRRPRELARLRCPALERVTLLAGKDTPPVLCAERIAPVLDLLAHSRVRPKIVLAGGVELDVWAQLRMMWLTYRIPVSA